MPETYKAEGKEMDELSIRAAAKADIPEINRIYDAAKDFMRSYGNASQWTGEYPWNMVESDIEKGQCFLVESAGRPCAVFAFILGDDPTYSYIEDGAWPNSEPYGTVHRVGSDGSVKGLMRFISGWAMERVDNLRVDTHEKNLPMKSALTSAGFSRCGVIYIDDGTPRTAFQKSR